MQDLSPDAAVDKADVHQPSAVVRHLGLIKALAIIMAVLIVAALVVIVVTIYSRLQAGSANRAASEVNLVLPAGAHVSTASSDKSGMVLVLDMPDGQQIWRMTNTGRVKQKITLKAD